MKIMQLHQPEIAKYRESIIQLLKLCMATSFSNKICEDFYTKKIDMLEQYLKENRAYFYIAIDDQIVLGMLWACKLDTPLGSKFHVLYFAVMPERQGEGIGTSLLNKAEEEAQILNIPQIELIVSSENRDAVQFYQRLSYKTERIILSKQV